MLVSVPIKLVGRKIDKVYADRCYLSQNIVPSPHTYVIAGFHINHPECELDLTL